MICSSDERKRRFAVQKILKVRKEDFENIKCRKRRIPRINPEARKEDFENIKCRERRIPRINPEARSLSDITN